MSMTADQLRALLAEVVGDTARAERLLALCPQLAGRTARADGPAVQASLRRLAVEYLLPRLGGEGVEGERLAGLLLANWAALLDTLAASGVYDLTKVAVAAAKLLQAQGMGEEAEAEMAERFDTALAALPEPLLDATLAEVGGTLGPALEEALATRIVAVTEATLAGAELPGEMRVFLTSSVLFAWFHEAYPHGPRILAAGLQPG